MTSCAIRCRITSLLLQKTSQPTQVPKDKKTPRMKRSTSSLFNKPSIFSLVIKDLVYEAKAKAKTFFSRPRPRPRLFSQGQDFFSQGQGQGQDFFLKAKAKAKTFFSRPRPRPRLFSQGQGQGHENFSRQGQDFFLKAKDINNFQGKDQGQLSQLPLRGKIRIAVTETHYYISYIVTGWPHPLRTLSSPFYP